ncbi:LysR family transcriptional regulator [Photorhabdus luminescens]|nr:LysR family transcriptional regulator [Photorhabdus luminescens]
MNNLSGFIIFIHVAEARSFATAARQLGLSPSSVSKSISRLEEKLGVRLLQRSTRSVSLTAEGTLFLERCKRILDEISTAEHELLSSISAPQGRLRVSLPSLSNLMLPVLSAFATCYPQIELELDFSDRLVDVIDEGFDAVVRTGELNDSRLMNKRIGSSRLVYVGAPGYFAQHGKPSHPGELLRHACLMHRFPTTGLLEKWPLRSGTSEVDIHLQAKITSNHVETLLHMAIQGHGIACLPDFTVKQALVSGELLTILDKWAGTSSTFRVLWPSNRWVLPKVRAFVDFMADNLFPKDK